MELVRWLLGALAAHLEDLGSTPLTANPLLVHNRRQLQLQRIWRSLLATDGTAHM